ncbi:hypothetical protein PIB30_088586 [Stylosanthes scabra]|uniref:Uncharacterized protein n=1 Tax=Stylosanthes scabra TaxID=79078 RepID=A0ABU6RTN5_9FABA|nr:hypothetical protein [Stylosanthes scabra]
MGRRFSSDKVITGKASVGEKSSGFFNLNNHSPNLSNLNLNGLISVGVYELISEVPDLPSCHYKNVYPIVIFVNIEIGRQQKDSP